MLCRFDKQELTHEFVDLGHCPPSNSLLTAEQLDYPEVTYPLRLWVSERSFLVQVNEYKKAEEIFNDEYVYFSSYSTSWLAHSRAYVEMIHQRLGLSEGSFVVEIASNDGYLLQYFKERGIPCMGIEPCANVAEAAREKGIETRVEFFGTQTAATHAEAGRKADLLLGNNVLAHVPDINDFVGGLKQMLKPSGVVTMEFPHLMQLIDQNQFDTIYHEHFSYLSCMTVQQIFAHHGLRLFDVEELPTHGGSLRIFACHDENTDQLTLPAVEALLEKERGKGMADIAYYQGFQKRVNAVRNALLKFLIDQHEAGKQVIGYGAAAKGNTLLNYCGVRKDLLHYVVDKSPHKQGKFLPGCHIPVVDEAHIRKSRPDYVLILPWNIREEIMEQLAYVREWGAQFVVAIPELKVL